MRPLAHAFRTQVHPAPDGERSSKGLFAVATMIDGEVKSYSWDEFKSISNRKEKKKRTKSRVKLGQSSNEQNQQANKSDASLKDLIDISGGMHKFIEIVLSSSDVVSIVSGELLARGLINTAFSRGMKTKKSGDFYSSKAWATVRYAALMKHGAKCQCCGATAADGARMHVDHIKPRSKYPDLALELSNLQVLCDLCNVAKSNIDQTDWSKSAPNENGEYYEYREEEKRIVRLLKSIV